MDLDFIINVFLLIFYSQTSNLLFFLFLFFYFSFIPKRNPQLLKGMILNTNYEQDGTFSANYTMICVALSGETKILFLALIEFC